MSNDSMRTKGNPPTRHASTDYRDSHLERGKDYDARLSANAFDAYMTRWETHWLTRFLRNAYPTGVPRYLDFACGTGRVTATVAPFAREAIGVDISPSMLDVARAKCPQVSFMLADITQDTAGLGTFDLITSFRFFGNAQDELRTAALRAITTLLAPSGHLVINSHRNPHSVASLLHASTGGASEMDLHYFKLKRLLAQHGLRVVHLRAIGFWMFRARMLARVDANTASAFPERLLGWPMFAPFAPDLLLVAQKVQRS